MTGFLIFGNSLHWFSSFGASINTCFEMLLGEFAGVSADLRALGGLQAAAGSLFFWSFELLVFLVLLNFLLAIIVDAFCAVKEATKETTGIHVELARLLGDRWRRLTGAWSGRYVGAATLDAIMREWGGVQEEEEEKAAAAAAAAVAASARHHQGGQEEEEPRVLQARLRRCAMQSKATLPASDCCLVCAPCSPGPSPHHLTLLRPLLLLWPPNRTAVCMAASDYGGDAG